MPENSLVGHLRNVAVAAKVLNDATEVTRLAIGTLGEQVAHELAQLDQTQLEAVGIKVKIVTRSDGPIFEAAAGLEIEHLPTIEDTDRFERRQGTTALYLSAFEGTQDRELLQIQSTPGVMVSATSSLDQIEDWLEPIRGIVIVESGEARMVTERVIDNHIVTNLGANAHAIVHTFLEALSHKVQLRARFNRATDLPQHKKLSRS